MRMKRTVGIIVCFVLGLAVAAATQSTKSGGFSTKAIQALENCFDSGDNFICGGGGITGIGEATQLAVWDDVSTLSTSIISDNGSVVNVQLPDGGSFQVNNDLGDIEFTMASVSGGGNNIQLSVLDDAASGLAAMKMLVHQPNTSQRLFEFDTDIDEVDGGETVDLFGLDFNFVSPTGANTVFGFRMGTIPTPDPALATNGFATGAGWDAIFNGDVDTDGWSPTADPPTNSVSFYLDESGADCNFMARLADGTDVVVAALVVAGDCP